MSMLTFANGDTDYVAKLNANFTNAQSALDALNNLLAGQIQAALGPGAAYTALFGSTVAVIGAGSYESTGASTTLTVAAGYAWLPSLSTVVTKGTSTALSFAGQAAATYYVVVDQTGAPSRSASSTEALYSVVWDGAAFGTITRLASVVWGAEDDLAAQTSTALADTFDSLDDRLEAGEALAVDGDKAHEWAFGRLSKSVAGGDDVSLTAEEGRNLVINLTGLLTDNIAVDVVLSGAPRFWIVTNNTTGAFTVTFKASAGTGVAIAQTGDAALVYSDGTNIVDAIGSGGGGLVTSVNGESGSVTLDAADIDITDVGTYYTGTDVEAALQEIGADLAVLIGASDVDTDVTYTSDTGSTSDADPGAGLFKWNHATQASATALYVDNQTAGAVSLTTFFASLPADGYIHLAQDDDATKWQLWKWSGLPTAATGYYKFTGLTLMASGGSIADDKATSVSFKGTAPSSYPYDVYAMLPGLQTSATQLIYRGKLARAVTFAADFAGSYFTATANATASTVFDVQKNGSSIGSVTIGAGGTTATFTTSGGTSKAFVAGDVLALYGPATADATLADASFSFAGTR
jgi:hypothetical protein